MASYDLFLIRNGTPVDRLSDDFPNDVNALDRAKALSSDGDCVVEVYQGIRLVARLKPNDAG
jgi:hypothetical protein